jgi:hypothetical protein
MAIVLRYLASPSLLFYTIPWLMFLLVGGTIAQRYIGLYQSEKLFFGSFIFWFGPAPLPGAYLTLGLIAVSLCLKLILKSPWKKEQAGTILSHLSVCILLCGGLITAFCNEEGYIVLGPGESGRFVSDYHQRELAILKNGAQLLMVPYEKLHAGTRITDALLPFSIHIDTLCYHCVVFTRKSARTALHGAAETLDIKSEPPLKDEEENQSGVAFDITGATEQINGAYITFEPMRLQPSLTLGTDRYDIVMRRKQRELPFALQLKHFEKSDYPGTEKARSYSSEVTVKDGKLEWDATIEMNQPLRHLGYTLYQSSFVENDGKLYTVLAVVKNTGALFPYIALTALCAGLLLHLGIMFLPKSKV